MTDKEKHKMSAKSRRKSARKKIEVQKKEFKCHRTNSLVNSKRQNMEMLFELIAET
jgi:hypothetical protein